MDKLLFLINKSGLRQNYIAEKFNISAEYLSLILNGKRKGNRIKEKIINFLETYNNETKGIDINACSVAEKNNAYSVKDDIILSQAEEIFLLKKQLLDLTDKINELEEESGGLMKDVIVKEAVTKIKKNGN